MKRIRILISMMRLWQNRQILIQSFLFVLVVMWTPGLHASGYVPTSLGGSVTYTYGLTQSQNVTAESTSVSVGISMAAYIWQPWFITNANSIAFSLSRSAADGTGETTATSVSGQTNFELFSRSRVPFGITYSRGTNQTDVTNPLSNLSTIEYTTSSLVVRQAYLGRENFYGNFIFSHYESESDNDYSESDTYSIRARKRVPKHLMSGDMTYSTNGSKNATSKPERVNASVNHSYYPGTSINVSSNVNFSSNKNKGIKGNTENSESESIQFGSYFSWRPSYRAFSVSGGARVASATSSSAEGQDSKSGGVSLGMSYQLSTRVQMSGSASAGLSITNDVQTTTANQVGTVTFSSDQYTLLGFTYGWSANSSATNSVIDTDNEDTQSDQTVSTGLSHRASRFWNVGRLSELTMGVSQSASAGKSFDEDAQVNQSVSHSLNFGLSTRGKSGSTYISWSVSDSRNFGESEAEFQQVGANISRNQTINRLSSLTANSSFRTSRQASEGQNVKTDSNFAASVNYQHNQFLGVFRMPFKSSVVYTNPLTNETGDDETIVWKNTLEYTIGLLSTNLSANASKTGSRDPTYSLFFRATRSF